MYIKAFTFLLFIFILAAIGHTQGKLTPEPWKRIEAESPKPLPQSPVVKRETSDAQDDGLKGKVKRVINEYRSYTDVYANRGRVISNIDDYDQSGNQTRNVNFANGGMLYGIDVYGYINGWRVSLDKTVGGSYGRYTEIGAPPPKPNPATQKPDERYTYKYEYSYTDGNLTLMRMFHNDGKRGMYYKYSTSPTERSTSAFTEDDEHNWRTIYKLDEKGNEIQWTNVDVRKVYGSDKVYRIDNKTFDKAGNWTHRTRYEVKTIDGKPTETLISEEFRTITYH
jgi:hypothetical protein